MKRSVALSILLSSAAASAEVASARQETPNALTASLPRSSGEVHVEGLAAPVEITRDALGCPTIRAASKRDVLIGQGYVLAQDRYFQMDLARRLAGGTLAELIGPPGVQNDLQRRREGFAHIAAAMLDTLPPAERDLWDAFTLGINAGLRDLAAPPPEYTFLQQTPAPWTTVDSAVTALGLYPVLHRTADAELVIQTMRRTLPAALVDFLITPVDRMDVPLIAEPDLSAVIPPIPGADLIDLRAAGSAPVDLHAACDIAADWMSGAVPGSNNWAVAGSRSVHGGAILCNDPHLPLTAPGVWYRMRLEWPGNAVTGVAFPGTPDIVIGSTGSIAWGFTNTTGDFQDYVIVTRDENDSSRYRVPGGWESIRTRKESIPVRGAAAQELWVEETRWGPITATDSLGHELALHWTALDPALAAFRIFELTEARTAAQALEIFARTGGPSQNALVADSEGHIGWTITGALPARRGFDGLEPADWSTGEIGWEGTLPESDRPRVIDPPSGVLWTANNRTLPWSWARKIGWHWDGPERAQRIAERLTAKEKFSEEDLLDIQRDAAAEPFEIARTLFLKASESAAADSDLGLARAAAQAWDGAANEDSVGFALVQRYATSLYRTLLRGWTAPCKKVDPRFDAFRIVTTDAVRRALEARPMHLLPQPFESYEAMFRTLAERVAAEMKGAVQRRWGEENRVLIQHPASAIAPSFRQMLDMPDAPLAGHWSVVRVAVPGFGASMRMVVSPSHEALGLFNMPAGQSGHPLSPNYRDGQESWRVAAPAPFLPGPAVGASVRLLPIVDGDRDR